MSDTVVEEAGKRVRHKADLVEIDFDDIPDLTRAGRTSQLKQRVEKVREDNTGKPRLIAKYHSAASASSAATAQRKAFAGQGFKFAVRPVDGQTGLFVIWNAEWVGADDAPKPRKRKNASGAEAAISEIPEPETPVDNGGRRGRR